MTRSESSPLARMYAQLKTYQKAREILRAAPPRRHPAPASMKALPKRKGNSVVGRSVTQATGSLNESPSQKEGKCGLFAGVGIFNAGLNESPSQKEGKSVLIFHRANRLAPQ